MGEYIYKLIEEKKELQKKIKKYNSFVDSGFGKKDYFARRHATYGKVEKLRKRIDYLNKKIEFMLNLSDIIERKIYEEQINKSDID